MRSLGTHLLTLLATGLTGLWTAEVAAAPPKVFIETEVDPHDPYVQAAARVTVRVYSARALYRSDLDLPAPSDARVHQVGGDDHGTARRDNRAYDVLTRRYLVFAQRSGQVRLPGAVLSAQILTSTGRTNRFNNDPSSGAPLGASPYAYGALSVAVEALLLRGEAIVLDVRPRPTGAVGSYWLPARQVSLTSAWHPESEPTHVGDALTLSVALQAEGLPAEQLPDLASLIRVPQGLKAYPDEPKLDTANRGDTLIGRREQSIALIADQAGRFTLPPLQLRWWDTVRNVLQEVTVPARTVVVIPASAAPQGAGRAASPAGGVAGSSRFDLENPWRWVSLALAAAWLATLASWYASRRVRSAPQAQRGSPRSVSRSRARFFDACRANDAQAARRHLLAWADAEWPAPPPAGLNGMGKVVGDSHVAQLLRDLDRACYGGGAWQGEALARAFVALPAPPRRAAAPASHLAPLYR